MKFGAAISRVDKLTKKLSGGKIIEDAMILSLKKSVLLVHATAIKGIQKASIGERVTRYNPKRNVYSSKPGDPPNTDTGRLIQSIQFEFEEGGRIGYVGTNLKYGPYLEFGTERMAARPWLAPALQKAADKIADTIKKDLNKGIAKAFGVQDVVKSLELSERQFKRIGKSAKKTTKKAKRVAKKASRAGARASKRATKKIKSTTKKVKRFFR